MNYLTINEDFPFYLDLRISNFLLNQNGLNIKNIKLDTSLILAHYISNIILNPELKSNKQKGIQNYFYRNTKEISKILSLFIIYNSIQKDNSFYTYKCSLNNLSNNYNDNNTLFIK